MAKTVTIKINGRTVQAKEGMTILQAAQQAGIYIPTLCYHPDLSVEGVCRICVVEVEGQRLLCPSCAYPVSEGLNIITHSPKVREARRMIVELLLANHPQECLTCAANQKCELQKLAKELGIQEVRFLNGRHHHAKDDSNPAIIRNPEKCILCKRCVRVCHEIQSVGA